MHIFLLCLHASDLYLWHLLLCLFVVVQQCVAIIRCVSLVAYSSPVIILYTWVVLRRVAPPFKSPVLLSSRKVLVLEDPREPIFKSLSSSSEIQVLENFRGLSELSVSALCAGVSAGVAMT